MKTTRKVATLAATLITFGSLAGGAKAAVIFSPTIFSPTGTVATADRVATFDSLTTNGIQLSTYSEDGLSIVVAGSSWQGFSAFTNGDSRTTGFHYASNGTDTFVTITGTDGKGFSALQFLLGDGKSDPSTNLNWEAYSNGSLVGSGLESALTRGSIVGWTDASGFDEIRVAALSSESSPGFGNYQAIAIDDLQVTIVPEPSSALLLGLGGLSLAARRRRTK